MFSATDIAAITITLKLALITTILLMLLAPPIAWWLSHTRSKARSFIEALVAMPLVLPPTVLGFYLLLLFSPDSPVGGAWLQLTGSTLAFNFSGLVIGSIFYSLPFAVQPLQSGFHQIDHGLLQAATTLGASPWNVFTRVIFPLTKRSFIIAATLCFAHTIGEFGVVLMLGGNIPGKTQVISIALFDHVESLNYTQAHWLAAVLVVFSLVVLWLVYGLQGNKRQKRFSSVS
ncbi:molybdate ABC transporter permease subunit [Zooshikella marina]|uniref:molybdate ABC transporter permease subunit n=1 Tax=Zooshikella ganghwensis TaxID=202772 RepID=UPI001BAF79BA|nr:molybdate ABC transporter permease subunit [Zooshikella ganghwensis]MBU2706416.1 molybdate ABC transporter permease subunit [Zooshikella ganghwensis]